MFIQKSIKNEKAEQRKKSGKKEKKRKFSAKSGRGGNPEHILKSKKKALSPKNKRERKLERKLAVYIREHSDHSLTIYSFNYYQSATVTQQILIMDKTKSTAAGKSSAAAKAESTSVTPKRTMVRRRANTKMVQNALLIWLDANIDEDNDADCQNTITQLQRVVKSIKTFTNGDQCIEFIDTIDTNNNKACMIISGSFGQQIVPHVHKMSQVDSIFIFCSNKKYHEQWAKDWAKIKGVFTEINPICEALKVAAQQCEHNATPISFMATDGDDTNPKKLDQLDCSFMYTQILKDILLTIKFEQNHIQEFIEHCREQFIDNEEELVNVKELERKYHKETPVWWYTCESFLYPMLNTALRLMDVDVMIKMGFFITDLHCQIKELHTEQFGDHTSSTTLTVYRGQGMSKKDFEQMTKTMGGLIAFNSFLSTSRVRQISLNFARNALSNPDLVGILFVMTIDPSQSTTPFASINDVGAFKDREGEVLFSMHSVFRIRDIKSMGENNRLYQVNLTLTNDNDKDLRALTDRIREEMRGSTGWDRLGFLLLKMRQSEKAEQVYQILLGQTTDKIEKATFYLQLGSAKNNRGEYKEALALYEKSLAIREQSLPPNHLDLANSYLGIGNVYSNIGEYSKALSYYEKALAIQQQSLPPNHPGLAASYNNIGSVYSNMGEYSKALLSHEKALAIKQQSLPPTHPDLASSYNNIGSVYKNMGEYSKALSYYEKALAIRQQSLPPSHPDLAMSYGNIGSVYYNMGEYSKALSYYEKTLAIRQQSLPPNHPDLANSYMNIGNVYRSMGEYSKALSYYEKALAIQQQSLPPNHPDLANSYMNIGNVYYSMGEYLKALSYYEKALAIQQQSLPANHPDLAMSYMNIGLVYNNMGEYSKALSSHEKALSIKQQSLPPNHPELASSYNNIGSVYKNMGEYSKALSYYEKALAIRQQSLPPNHPDLANSYHNIGVVYENMGDYSKARSFYKRAVDIAQQSLPPDHPHRQIYSENLDRVKKLK